MIQVLGQVEEWTHILQISELEPRNLLVAVKCDGFEGPSLIQTLTLFDN